MARKRIQLAVITLPILRLYTVRYINDIERAGRHHI